MSTFIHPNILGDKICQELASINPDLRRFAIDVTKLTKGSEEQLYISAVQKLGYNEILFLTTESGTPVLNLEYGPTFDEWENCPSHTFKARHAFCMKMKDRSSRGGCDLIQSAKIPYLLKIINENYKDYLQFANDSEDGAAKNVFTGSISHLDDKYFDISSHKVMVDFLTFHYLIENFNNPNSSDIHVPSGVISTIRRLEKESMTRFAKYKSYIEDHNSLFSGHKFLVSKYKFAEQERVSVGVYKISQEKIGDYSFNVDVVHKPVHRMSIEDHYDDPIFGEQLKTSVCFMKALSGNNIEEHYRVSTELGAIISHDYIARNHKRYSINADAYLLDAAGVSDAG